MRYLHYYPQNMGTVVKIRDNGVKIVCCFDCLSKLPFFSPLAAALHDSELDGEAVEVILVEVSVIVEVVEVAHQELDPVVPAVVCSHLKTG